jgi:uncharacterized protein (TIGR02246 family)
MHIESYKPQTSDEVIIVELYHRLLQAWNRQDAKEFSKLFSGTGLAIGFDGTQMMGHSEIEEILKTIFADHKTGSYVFKVRTILHIDTHCLLLHAVAGMIPAGETKINPAINAVQTLLAVNRDSRWHIDLFQNTPAQFHGNPVLFKSLSDELNELTPA